MTTKNEMTEMFAFSSAVEDIVDAWALHFEEFTEEELRLHIDALEAVLLGEMDYYNFVESTNLARKPSSRAH